LTDLFRSVSLSNPVFEHENLRAVTVKSAALGHRGDVLVWVPEAAEISTLLILLHGVYGSHWSWRVFLIYQTVHVRRLYLQMQWA
jgi:putative tributyrin esterase